MQISAVRDHCLTAIHCLRTICFIASATATMDSYQARINMDSSDDDLAIALEIVNEMEMSWGSEDDFISVPSTSSGITSKLKTKITRPVVIDCSDSDEIDLDNIQILKEEDRNNCFKRNSSGDLIIDPAQRPQRRVRFDLPDIEEERPNEEEIVIDDIEERPNEEEEIVSEDDIPIAERKRQRNRREDPKLKRIFEDNYDDDFIGFDPLYNPYIQSRPSVLVAPLQHIENFQYLKDVHLNITCDERSCLEWLKQSNLIAPQDFPCPRCTTKNLNGHLRYIYSPASDRKAHSFLKCSG